MISSFASARIDRARHSSCRSPTENASPPSPTAVSSFSGSFSRASFICAFSNASHTCASVYCSNGSMFCGQRHSRSQRQCKQTTRTQQRAAYRADAAREERRVLGQHGDGLAQLAQTELSDIHAVDADASGVQLHDAEQQVHQSRFPAARASHHAHLLVRLDFERHVLQHEGELRPVARADSVEADRTVSRPVAGRLDQLCLVTRIIRGFRVDLGVVLYALDGIHLDLQLRESVDEPLKVASHLQRVGDHHRSEARIKLVRMQADPACNQRGEASRHRVETNRKPAKADVLRQHCASETVVVAVVLDDQSLLLIECAYGLLIHSRGQREAKPNLRWRCLRSNW